MEIDVPFCIVACGFCRRQVFDGLDTARMRAYSRALIREIEANAAEFADCEISAVRFDGGTASNLGQELADVMRTIRNLYDVPRTTPVTMRTAISNISGATFPMFSRAGVTRYDLEMLSMYQPSFARFNQVDAFANYAIVVDDFLHSYANDSLGLVLLFGHDEMTPLDFRRSCLAAASTHACHIELVCAEGDHRADEELVAQHLSDAREVFGEKGFFEYLPLMFCREGCEDAWYLGRQEGRETIAFGLGATTCMDGALSTNTRDLATYLEHSNDFTLITAEVQPLASK